MVPTVVSAITATRLYIIVSPGAKSTRKFISSSVEVPDIGIPGLVPFDELVGDSTLRVQEEKVFFVVPSSCSAVIELILSITEILFANFSVSLLVTSIL